MSAWASHIEGAVALCRARGVKQFEGPQSLLLFRAVRTHMLVNAVQQRKAIVDFPDPKGWLGDIEGDQSEAFNLVEFSIRLPNILSQAKPLLAMDKTAEATVQVAELLDQALEVQKALLNWERYMPLQWAYKSAANVSGTVDPDNVDSMDAWPGPMHMYGDVHISGIRNNNRVSQILCSSVVIDALKWLDPDHFATDERFLLSRNRVQSLMDDICYSVPFHLWGQDLGEKVRPEGQLRVGE